MFGLVAMAGKRQDKKGPEHPAPKKKGRTSKVEEEKADAPVLAEDEEKLYATKAEKDKLYSAVRYAASKGQDNVAKQWNMCTTPDMKKQFWKQWKVDKKFSWCTISEKNSLEICDQAENIEGWMSKYQVAAMEKVPVDSPLLEDMLKDFPSRAHRCASWAARDEKEYYYTGAQRVKHAEGRRKELSTVREARMEKGCKEFDSLHASLGGEAADQQLRAIEDLPQVKEEPGVAALQERHKQSQTQLVKLHKQACDLYDTGLATKGKLGTMLAQKPYLKEMSSMLDQAVSSFGTFKDELKMFVGGVGEVTETMVLSMEAEVGKAAQHIEGMKNGIVKELQMLLK